ncbi:hypothetical protein RhiirB3_383800 [Rhizophagus irregularis]|nr:hypothetical protein RhiirB3_383800 [Rhizophagus irregularis]
MSPVTLNCLVAGENSYENDLKLITDIIFNDKAAAQFMLYQRNLGVMKILFSLKADSYDQLTCIEIGSSATPEEISNSAIEDFLIHKASLPITSANEATGCEFISAIIYGVASIFDGTVKVIPKDLQQRAKMEDNEAQLAEQLLNSGWNAQDSDNNHISDLSDELLECESHLLWDDFDPFFHEGHDIAQDIMKHLTSWNGHGLKYSPDSKETSDNIKLARNCFL